MQSNVLNKICCLRVIFNHMVKGPKKVCILLCQFLSFTFYYIFSFGEHHVYLCNNSVSVSALCDAIL